MNPSSTIVSNGGADDVTSDELKIFKEEGTEETEKRDSERGLDEEKSSLVNITDSDKNGNDPNSANNNGNCGPVQDSSIYQQNSKSIQQGNLTSIFNSSSQNPFNFARYRNDNGKFFDATSFYGNSAEALRYFMPSYPANGYPMGFRPSHSLAQLMLYNQDFGQQNNMSSMPIDPKSGVPRISPYPFPGAHQYSPQQAAFYAAANDFKVGQWPGMAYSPSSQLMPYSPADLAKFSPMSPLKPSSPFSPAAFMPPVSIKGHDYSNPQSHKSSNMFPSAAASLGLDAVLDQNCSTSNDVSKTQVPKDWTSSPYNRNIPSKNKINTLAYGPGAHNYPQNINNINSSHISPTEHKKQQKQILQPSNPHGNNNGNSMNAKNMYMYNHPSSYYLTNGFHPNNPNSVITNNNDNNNNPMGNSKDKMCTGEENYHFSGDLNMVSPSYINAATTGGGGGGLKRKKYNKRGKNLAMHQTGLDYNLNNTTFDAGNMANNDNNCSNIINNNPTTPHIKKPLNAFMLFMKEHRAKVMEECTLKESSAINQLLGRKWHGLTRDEQAKYYELARKERQIHMQLYPGWSARDNYTNHANKIKRKHQKKRSSLPLGGGGNIQQPNTSNLTHMNMNVNVSDSSLPNEHDTDASRKISESSGITKDNPNINRNNSTNNNFETRDGGFRGNDESTFNYKVLTADHNQVPSSMGSNREDHEINKICSLKKDEKNSINTTNITSNFSTTNSSDFVQTQSSNYRNSITSISPNATPNSIHETKISHCQSNQANAHEYVSKNREVSSNNLSLSTPQKTEHIYTSTNPPIENSVVTNDNGPGHNKNANYSNTSNNMNNNGQNFNKLANPNTGYHPSKAPKHTSGLMNDPNRLYNGPPYPNPHHHFPTEISASKKCRARFGIDHLSSWCKPCRRKKKCIKFIDEDDSTKAQNKLNAQRSELKLSYSDNDEPTTFTYRPYLMSSIVSKQNNAKQSLGGQANGKNINSHNSNNNNNSHSQHNSKHHSNKHYHHSNVKHHGGGSGESVNKRTNSSKREHNNNNKENNIFNPYGSSLSNNINNTNSPFNSYGLGAAGVAPGQFPGTSPFSPFGPLYSPYNFSPFLPTTPSTNLLGSGPPGSGSSSHSNNNLSPGNGTGNPFYPGSPFSPLYQPYFLAMLGAAAVNKAVNDCSIPPPPPGAMNHPYNAGIMNNNYNKTSATNYNNGNKRKNSSVLTNMGTAKKSKLHISTTMSRSANKSSSFVGNQIDNYCCNEEQPQQTGEDITNYDNDGGSPLSPLSVSPPASPNTLDLSIGKPQQQNQLLLAARQNVGRDVMNDNQRKSPPPSYEHSSNNSSQDTQTSSEQVPLGGSTIEKINCHKYLKVTTNHTYSNDIISNRSKPENVDSKQKGAIITSTSPLQINRDIMGKEPPCTLEHSSDNEQTSYQREVNNTEPSETMNALANYFGLSNMTNNPFWPPNNDNTHQNHSAMLKYFWNQTQNPPNNNNCENTTKTMQNKTNSASSSDEMLHLQALDELDYGAASTSNPNHGMKRFAKSKTFSTEKTTIKSESLSQSSDGQVSHDSINKEDGLIINNEENDNTMAAFDGVDEGEENRSRSSELTCSDDEHKIINTSTDTTTDKSCSNLPPQECGNQQIVDNNSNNGDNPALQTVNENSEYATSIDNSDDNNNANTSLQSVDRNAMNKNDSNDLYRAREGENPIQPYKKGDVHHQKRSHKKLLASHYTGDSETTNKRNTNHSNSNNLYYQQQYMSALNHTENKGNRPHVNTGGFPNSPFADYTTMLAMSSPFMNPAAALAAGSNPLNPLMTDLYFYNYWMAARAASAVLPPPNFQPLGNTVNNNPGYGEKSADASSSSIKRGNRNSGMNSGIATGHSKRKIHHQHQKAVKSSQDCSRAENPNNDTTLHSSTTQNVKPKTIDLPNSHTISNNGVIASNSSINNVLQATKESQNLNSPLQPPDSSSDLRPLSRENPNSAGGSSNSSAHHIKMYKEEITGADIMSYPTTNTKTHSTAWTKYQRMLQKSHNMYRDANSTHQLTAPTLSESYPHIKKKRHPDDDDLRCYMFEDDIPSDDFDENSAGLETKVGKIHASFRQLGSMNSGGGPMSNKQNKGAEPTLLSSSGGRMMKYKHQAAHQISPKNYVNSVKDSVATEYPVENGEGENGEPFYDTEHNPEQIIDDMMKEEALKKTAGNAKSQQLQSPNMTTTKCEMEKPDMASIYSTTNLITTLQSSPFKPTRIF